MVLTDAGRPKQDWAAGGLDALPIDLSVLGLAQDWRQNVLAATGGYAEILRRNLGEASPLRLPPAQNALATPRRTSETPSSPNKAPRGPAMTVAGGSVLLRRQR